MKIQTIVIFLCAMMIASGSFAQSTTSPQDVAIEDVSVVRDFAPGPFGQVHVRIATPEGEIHKTPLVLFHPAPYSGDFFAAFMRLMAVDRVVIALDTPGYGDSARPPEPQTIPAYTSAVAAALEALGYGDGAAVDVLGYHTGGLIAVELAASRPEMVRRLVLPGLPFYMGEARQKAYEENVKPLTIDKSGAHLEGKWAFANYAADAGLTLERAQEHFNDLMQCTPHCWWAYHGVFTYPSEERFPAVSQPVLLMSISASLATETTAAQRYFSNATLIAIEGAPKGSFDLIPEKLAAPARLFLDE